MVNFEGYSHIKLQIKDFKDHFFLLLGLVLNDFHHKNQCAIFLSDQWNLDSVGRGGWPGTRWMHWPEFLFEFLCESEISAGAVYDHVCMECNLCLDEILPVTCKQKHLLILLNESICKYQINASNQKTFSENNLHLQLRC